MLLYILKFSACLAILLLFYKLFLERENMHVFKRFYLLGALVFSLFVPQLVFTEYVVVEPTPDVFVQPATPSTDVIEVPEALEADILDIAPFLWGLYFLGLLFFGLNFIKNLIQVYRRIKKNPKEKDIPFIRVLLRENYPPHTFFNYIFLNKAKFESNDIPMEVILHEETHARQKHSLDVVFIELLQVVFWVNPFVYFFKKAIKLNHEFLADSAVLNKNIDAVTYQNTLLSFLSSESAKKYQPTLPNAINYSSIKKRFTIMKSKTSKKSVALRTFLLLPVLSLLAMAFTETKVAPVSEETFSKNETQKKVQDKATKEQVAEYNALADKYNRMIDAGKNIWIEKGDIERLEYLYSLMSDAQRENAEPFPNFPEPPEPPTPAEPLVEMEEEMLEMEREMERQEEASKKQEKAMLEQERAMIEQEQAVFEQEQAMKEQEIEMERQEQKMRKDKAELERQAIEIDEQERRLSPPRPPAPPAPKSPLKLIKEMAEQGAKFYYKKKKISSNEAIELLKKNDDLSINIKKKNNDAPIVRIDTHL